MFDDLYQGAYKPMPNVMAVRVDGSRHFIMLDQPEKLFAAIDSFLALAQVGGVDLVKP